MALIDLPTGAVFPPIDIWNLLYNYHYSPGPQINKYKADPNTSLTDRRELMHFGPWNGTFTPQPAPWIWWNWQNPPDPRIGAITPEPSPWITALSPFVLSNPHAANDAEKRPTPEEQKAQETAFYDAVIDQIQLQIKNLHNLVEYYAGQKQKLEREPA